MAVRKKGSYRLTFENSFAIGFATPIPEVFDVPLQKKALSTGDVFFSGREAYENRPWDEVLQALNWVVQIKESMTGGETVFFEILRPSPDKRALSSEGHFKLHWDEFVSRLKLGSFDGFESLEPK